ncbi:MAG TPA: hypothetical protein VK456_03030 [Xanthobacteraceae bacterium]|nr:hypothetical protein [Xanthobacteraceae bacterium]
MMKRTTLALSAALVLGSASTALAQYASPGPDYYGAPPAGYYGAPYGNSGWAGSGDVWWSSRRALHQGRGTGDTNGW